MTDTVVGLGVAVAAVGLLTAMSVRANRRFRSERRLPMQWWVDGSVTWSAPRPVALAFTPVLAAVCLCGLAVVKPRAGQEHLVIPAFIIGALVLLGLHALHLQLVQRALQRRG